MILWEIKKILKSKTGLIILGLLIFLSGIMFFLKPTLETENSYRNDKYELVIDDRAGDEIAKEKFNEKINQIEQMANTYVNDESIKKIIEISRENLRFMKYREYKDVSFFKVFDHRADHPFMSVVMVIILVLIFSNIYTDEKISSVDSIILSSKNKFKVLYSKLALSIILPILIYGLYLVIAFLVTVVQNGMPVNGELEAFRIIDNGAILLNGTYTINNYLILKISTMISIFISISVFSSFFSFISANSLASISGTLIFLVLGKSCTLIKFLPGELLTILSSVNYVDLIFYPDRFIGMYCGQINVLGNSLDLTSLCNGILIFMLFMGLGLCVFTFKKILTR
ncbi:hypothetical protein [Tepidibacter hydrothermalis]|uniref:ABC-2 family transporter protein n=1 Tax=Tepidibacter hydrothermalis TaxID=3036126 RepID=A0ABY8EFI0_9FIRM|nr:hypothetical protein [Tepidibacter hydrothermalis]WFD10242.1 hypothetical protein P4S50_18080 [Tepidibacter hydrothermalis]